MFLCYIIDSLHVVIVSKFLPLLNTKCDIDYMILGTNFLQCCRAIEMYINRIKWLLQGSKRVCIDINMTSFYFFPNYEYFSVYKKVFYHNVYVEMYFMS